MNGGKNGRDLIRRKSPWVGDPDLGEPPNHFSLTGYHRDDDRDDRDDLLW